MLDTKIQTLIDQKFSIFNINSAKFPIDKDGKGIPEWQKKSFDELVELHDNSSKLWGMKMGKHENGRCILSLDFDCCGKENENTEKRDQPCEKTILMKKNYLEKCSTKDGIYTSSTEGNMNVLIDYTNSPTIIEYVSKIRKNKFNNEELEILLGGYQAIPPSATKSKITGKIGPARNFLTENMFYVIQNESCFTFQFLESLFKHKLDVKEKQPIKKIKLIRKSNDKTDGENNESDLELTKNQKLLRLIKLDDKKDRTTWMRVCACLMSNGMTNEDWLQFGEDNKLNMDEEKLNLFKNFKTPYCIDINYLEMLAKKTNPEGYHKWQDEFKIYHIDDKDLDDPYKSAVVVAKTLKNCLVLCKENWYMLSENQLWKQQKEPSFYIVNELRKYIDESNKNVVERITATEGEEKEKLIEQSKKYLKSYKSISSSGFLNVLTKYLKTLLADDKFADKLDSNVGELAFMNGIVDLKTKIFREGILWCDYLTETIPFNYQKGDEVKGNFVKKILKEIMNNKDDHLEYQLSVTGHSFIGLPQLEKSIYFCVDKTPLSAGDNGKTFLYDILSYLMPNYVYKTKGSLLEEGNSKIHKQLAMMKGKRLVWMDEYGKKKSNAELMKEIGDGLKMENEIMFGTSESINILFKLFVLTNNMPNIDPSETAVYNRYKQLSYGSHFDRTGTRKVANPEKLEFIADPTLGDKIKNEYANEIFELIIEYANKYYVRKMKLPEIPEQFKKDIKETQMNNDKFAQWFDENCILGSEFKVSEKSIISMSGFKAKEVRESMKRIGLKYDKDLRGLGTDDLGNHLKGGFKGCKIRDEKSEKDVEEE